MVGHFYAQRKKVMKGHTHTHTHENPLNKNTQGHIHPELEGQYLITHSHFHTHPVNLSIAHAETIQEHEAKLAKHPFRGMIMR